MIELLLQLTHPGFSLDVDLNLPVRGVSAILAPRVPARPACCGW